MNSTTKPALPRIPGVAFGIAALLGATIGGGILRVPGTVAALVPQPSLLLALWVLVGIYVAELATAPLPWGSLSATLTSRSANSRTGRFEFSPVSFEPNLAA